MAVEGDGEGLRRLLAEADALGRDALPTWSDTGARICALKPPCWPFRVPVLLLLGPPRPPFPRAVLAAAFARKPALLAAAAAAAAVLAADAPSGMWYRHRYPWTSFPRRR